MNSTTQHSNTELDRASFTQSVERHRRELHVHCYRMMGSFEESEDLVQETFLRAWRRRETYEGRSSLRAWLYAIATNACLDALDKRPRTVSPTGEVLWLQPYPDELLESWPARRRTLRPLPSPRRRSSWPTSLRSSAWPTSARGADPARRARLLGEGDRGRARDERAGRQQRPAARAGDDEGAPARAAHRVAPGVDATAAERELLDRYVEHCETPDVPASSGC